MTDRELLEKAAKAEGHDYPWVMPARGGERPWNPLEDDGDAFRLQVRCRFHVNIFSACSSEGIDTPGFVEIWCGDCDPIHTEYVEGGDYEAATRRAIVRAAAAMAGDAASGAA